MDRALSLLAVAWVTLGAACGSSGTTVESTLLKTYVEHYGNLFPNPGAPLSVSSIFPKFGLSTKQTWTEITGNGFQLGAAVSVGGTACATTLVITETAIDCLVQPHAKGAVDVTITLLDSTSVTLTNGFDYY